MSGSQDPNYERVLGLIRPLVQPPFLPHPLGSPSGFAKSATNRKTPDVELEQIIALEQGLLGLVVTEWPWKSGREEIDVPVAALIDGSSDKNVISHAFVSENLPNVHENADRITLTFRPSSGGGSQSRHFRVLDVPHPMILGAGGVYSRQEPDKTIKGDINGGTDSRLLPAEEEHLLTVMQKPDSQQIIPHSISAPSKQNDKPSLSEAAITVSLPLESSQGDPTSSIHTKPRNTVSGILASSEKLARNVTAAAEASSAWGPSTGIALGAATMGTIGTGTAIYSATVAHGAKAVAKQTLELNREVFEHTKKKDAAAARAAAATSTPGVVRTSNSDSDSDDAESGVGGSSSKSTSVRARRGRASTPSAVTRGRAKLSSPGAAASQVAMGDVDLSNRFFKSPRTITSSGSSAPPGRLQPHDSRFPVPRTTQELDIIFPAVPTHSFNTRAELPEDKPFQVLDKADIEMDVLSDLPVNEALVDLAEGTQQGLHAYTRGSSTAKDSGSPSAEDAQTKKEESQSNVTGQDNFTTTGPLPIAQRSDVLQTGSKPEAVCEVNNIYGASDHLNLQKDSASSSNEQKQVQESETELRPQNEALPQQTEDQLNDMPSPAEFGQGSDSIPKISAAVTVEEQDYPCILFGRESTGGKTTLSTDSERAETDEVQLLISVSDKDTSHESAKNDEQEFEVEDSKSEESQITGDDTVENEVEGNEVEDEQIEDTGVDADSNDEEPAIRGEPEAFLLGLHKLKHARTV